ncbi:GNAT family N-acetyltransferase [Thalassomonas sp. RHCl1]|uniref:GNAT family N-acetyltransferase n=1 Tax=Thalassomonas sp. RHCl1 TaxID=2995320 RepID=UPI00248B7F2D|nr:GNAT family N-acetyltransferase [Thalassomonas sp. RHCl1]
MQLLNKQASKTLIDKIYGLYKRVDLTFDSILDSGMCQIYANNALSPDVFVIKNGIFCLLGGNSAHQDAGRIIKVLSTNSILLPGPQQWLDKLQASRHIELESLTRYSMSHQSLCIEELNQWIAKSGANTTIFAIDESYARAISKSEQFGYHLQNFSSAENFLARGIGFVACINKQIVAVASSALVCNKGIEINIMVDEKHRGKGIATSLGATLVKTCLTAKVIPHWDAGNEASLRLAQKLGYTRRESYIAYRIKTG